MSDRSIDVTIALWCVPSPLAHLPLHRECVTPASSPPLLQAHIMFQNNPPPFAWGAALLPVAFLMSLFFLLKPHSHTRERHIDCPLGCHGNRTFFPPPSSLFTLVRDCGKNQPVAEGEGGRKASRSKPDHSGSEWCPRPFPILRAAPVGVVGCTGRLWALGRAGSGAPLSGLPSSSLRGWVIVKSLRCWPRLLGLSPELGSCSLHKSALLGVRRNES